jgi:hypothetical protein
MHRSAAYNLLARVRDELEAGRFAVSIVLGGIDQDERIAQAAQVYDVTSEELRRCADNLQVTFVLRLFSEFEAVLRDYWKEGLGRSSAPDMRPLMESIARRRAMSQNDLDMAHEVRLYRNVIIHEKMREGGFDFSECKQRLGMYLRWLPLQWGD